MGWGIFGWLWCAGGSEEMMSLGEREGMLPIRKISLIAERIDFCRNTVCTGKIRSLVLLHEHSAEFLWVIQLSFSRSGAIEFLRCSDRVLLYVE